jgi:hypothetical protein
MSLGSTLGALALNKDRIREIQEKEQSSDIQKKPE